MEKNKKFTYILIIFSFLFVLTMALINKNCSKKNNQTIDERKISKIYNVVSQKILDEKIFYPYIKSPNDIFALSDKGIFFYKFDPINNSKIKLLDQKILDTQEVFYSSDGTQAIVISNYPSQNVKYYNFNNKIVKNLNKNISQVYFSKKQNIIYYSYFNNNKNFWTFSKSNPDGSNWQNIIELNNQGYLNFAMSPSEEKAIIYNSWTGTKSSPSYILDIPNKKLSEISKNIDIKFALWSPNGNKIIYIDTNNQLHFSNNDFSDVQKLDIISFKDGLCWKDNNNLIAVAKINTKNFTNQITNLNFYIINYMENSISKINIEPITKIDNLTFIHFFNNQIYFVDNAYLYRADFLQ